MVGLHSELSHKLLIVSELLPSLHDQVQTVKIDYSACVLLSLCPVKFIEPLMQVALLPEHNHLL